MQTKGSEKLELIVAQSTQRAVARELGTSQRNVHHWLHGKARPGMFHVFVMHTRYGISELDWLTEHERKALEGVRRRTLPPAA